MSSSSSFQYSSDSSTSGQYSSSSSEYCQFPECVGTVCINLTAWELIGVTQPFTDDGIIYIKTVFFPSTNTQQIELYQDSTYFNIIALGQVTSFVPTQITIEERNSSGISGTVQWDATPLNFSFSGTLYCIDLSSSSSTSSVDSSSTSSETSQSFSSSSSQCCNNVFCEGNNCSHFSNWNFSGMGDGNTVDCSMYVGLFVQGSTQQVRVYKELTLTNLTAIGQRTGLGLITLIEQNNSGLSGTVVWDGTLLPFPNTLALACSEFSSSSSSSSSSIDSSSSSSYEYSESTITTSSSSSSSSIDSSSTSSSEGYTSSSESSTSQSSSSSETSNSSSSSSSKDSSSTSSESFGNVSTSSSSSGIFWNQAKPLLLGLSSAANPNIKNRIAQTFKVYESTYSIGKVYVYLYRARGLNKNYWIRMSISDCNDDGSPKNELFLESIYASTIIKDDWYAFEFNISDETTPSNGYLSITLRHNGDEDNFVLWGYDHKNIDSDTLAWTSNNSTTWEEYENSVFSLKIVGSFEPFDPITNTITTPEAPDPIVVRDSITDGQIEYSDAILSFVIDSSGSMGTMDRYNNRKDIVECMVNKFSNIYPSDIKFDIFTFGGSNVDVSSFSSSLGSFATINLDLNSPSRTTYIFNVSGSDADVGAIYENDGYSFTVKHKLRSNESILVTSGTNDPIDAGTLNLVSGIGDSTINFSEFTKVTIEDSMISYGFKSLEDTHVYNIGDFKVDFEVVSPVGINNWQTFYPNNESSSLVLGNNAPLDDTSIDITASTNLIVRKLFTNAELYQSNISSIAYVGDTSVTVDDASGFVVGDIIDIVQGDAANIGREITEISGNTITFEDGVNVSITNHDLSGSIVQISSYNKGTFINGTTANILVRDQITTRNIIFYLQNSEGYFIEWDFSPFEEWVSYNIFFFGSTASLPMSFFETDGTPFPDGTQIDLVVNEKPDIFSKNEIDAVNVTTESFIGQTRIYLESTDGYFREQIIDILDKSGNIQTTEITEVSEDETGPYIDIADPLLFNVSESLGTTIRLNETEQTEITPSNNILSTEVLVVDVTPIVNNKDVDPSLLKPYDIARVPPSTPYEDLNLAKEFVQREVLDMPTIDSNVCARVLPIVEDILETVSEKEEDLSRLQRYSTESNIVSQLEQNEGDEETATELPTVSTTDSQNESVDYIIETPVFTNDGVAISSMQSFATEFLEKSFSGLTIPGIDNPKFFSKDYTIYASADFLSEGGRTLARLYLDPFEASFITPIVIDSTYVEGNSVQYYVIDPDEESCVSSYNKVNVRGHHASDENTITLNYIVANEFVLANNKDITVTLYTNRIVDLEETAQSVIYGSGGSPLSVTEQFANIRPLTTITTDQDGESVDNQLTEIDQWRAIVTNNPFEEVFNSVDGTDQGVTSDVDQFSTRTNNILDQYSSLINATLSEETSSGPSSLFYKNPGEWTLAKQYEQYEFTLPIVNGKATLEIPTSEIVSLLFVEAVVTFGDGDTQEQILSDMFFVANPITIAGINPNSIVPAENELYEVGTNIEYLDGSTVIEDNVQVNYSFKQISDNFRVEPSSSVTDNGWAGGVFIGPIDPIEPQPVNPSADKLCPPKIEVPVTIEVFHPSGYVRTVVRNVSLLGTSISDEEDTFIFYASDATNALYADGSTNPNAKITVNLDDVYNPTNIFIGEDGVERLKGKGQPNNSPRNITTFNASPRRTTFETNIVDLVALPKNKNIGHAQQLAPQQKFLEPWYSQVNSYTSYLKSDGSYRRGEIANGLPYPASLGGIVVPKPIQKYIEPLGIEVKFETNYTRDGLTTATIYAEITWKGEAITNKFTLNPGTEFESVIEYPLPKVTFESGTSKESNSIPGPYPSAKDSRNLISGTLVVSQNIDCVLSDYSVQSGLIRSDIFTNDSETEKHTHVISIDSDGNGTTSSTITLLGTVADHTHTFTNYESDEKLSHSHGVRCVAITTILPTDNIDTDFVVNGKVIYDPTNAEPYKNEPINPNGNRMMFATLDIPAGTELARRLVSKVEIGPDLDNGDPIFILDYESAEESEVIGPSGSEATTATFYTATSVDETVRGFDIRVFVKFPEYQYVDSIGNVIVVPEEFVEDGSRVTMELTAYKPQDSEGTDTGFLVMGAGIKRDYLVLKAKVSVTSDGFISERQFTINIASIQQWYPSIKHKVPYLTNDPIYLDTAINSFGFFGSSQLHDAVSRAAEEIVQYQTLDPTFENYDKFIIIITDGDENTSDNSLNQAIDTVDFINGKDEVQIIPIQLGQPHISDSVLIKKYAEEGNSSVFYLDNSSSEQISRVCDDIVSGSSLQVNTITLTGEITFEVPVISNTAIISGISVPSGAEVTYRIRTSLDNITFTNWTDFVDYSVPIQSDTSIDSLKKYIQYEIKITGNSNFETPVINGGVDVSYYNPREFIIFFKPVSVLLDDDEYISSIHITSEADIPENSTVEFLMTQSDSLKPEEYYNIIPDQHTVLPTRFNEILLTEDYKTYTAINGRWNSNPEIRVYRMGDNDTDGVLVSSSEYSSNNSLGTITFLSSQDPSTTIFMDVFFASSFRIAAKVTNFAENAAVIHHIGIMYNVSKRIPRRENGTIINVPISKRLTE